MRNKSKSAATILKVCLLLPCLGAAALQTEAKEKSALGHDSGKVRVEKDFREETIYFVLTARFFDGDPGNNYYNRDRIKLGDPHWRGDFKGLIEQLDYIKELGFSAIWISPPVENRSGLDYHGYHAYDWTKIDPRLESPGASYQDLIDAAHAKGLKIIQDVVINHSSSYGIRGKVWIDRLPIKYYRPLGGGPIVNGPYRDHLGDYKSAFREDNDNPLAPDWFRERQARDPLGVEPLRDPKTGVLLPKPGYDSQRFFGIDTRGLDPSWYHLDGFMNGGDWENPKALQKRHLAGDAIDLATASPEVQGYLNEAIGRYIEMGIDAIRLDTVKHVERDELLSYVDTWKRQNPELFVFGENLVKGTGLGSEISNDNASAVIRPWWYTRRALDPARPLSGPDSGFSVLDFGLFSYFRDSTTRGTLQGIVNILNYDWVYGDPSRLVTFFQNHDVGPDNDFKYRFAGEDSAAALTYNLLWTIRGIPSLYYGEEIGFQKGKPQDIDGSSTMTLDQTGRAYFGEHLESRGGGLERTRSHPLYQHIKRLNLLRRSIPALQKGSMEKLEEQGLGLSFVRAYEPLSSYVVVGLAAREAQNFRVEGVKPGTYRDAVSGRSIEVRGGTGRLEFTVPAYSAGIYVLEGPGQIGESGSFLR